MKSPMNFIFGEKHTLKVRMDLKEANVRPHLWPIPGEKSRSLTLQQASYVLTKRKKEVFADVVWQLKPPTHYVGKLRKKSPHGREYERIKSHDNHVLMQQLMFLCVHTIMRNEV